MTVAALVCGSCGAELSEKAKFCSECGAAVTSAAKPAEYKQVTVLFADVVHSMDIASAVGAERLREIMAELVNITTAVVKRYGGMVDKFTGEGIMAVFGAPVALEDHAVRACLAALGVQEEMKRLAVGVQERDGVDLRLRVGLNSGQVIAGEIGSGALGYTAIGQQVGMAQRMESVAPPGAVMLSASTARLVDGAATLGEFEVVQIKGADEPVPAQRLLGMGEGHRAVGRAESILVGRRWELSAVEGLLGRAIDGHGAVVGVVGSPGIGKSRLVREVAAMASDRSVEVFTAFCESHTSQLPFHAVARLLRAAFGVGDLDAQAARDRVRDRLPDADPEDLALFDDLLGIADPDVELPQIDPDARRRRLTALVNAASLARTEPAVFVIEDAHWIDDVSESMLAEFLTVIPQTPSLVLVTYRPEYRGALTRVTGAHTVALAPLSDSETTALVSELLGPDPSVGELGQKIAERASGNPFFAEEIVRDLAERGVLRGEPGAYVSAADIGEVSVPATLQATIAARIDRLDPKAKRTLSAAAVIGSRFSLDLLETLGIDPLLEDLVGAELVDQVRFTRQPEYVFHHPLIRMVAYEAQLKSDRAELHRRLAAAIAARDAVSVDKYAALIAEHLEAAGDSYAAYDWHMRAGAWSSIRDSAAARLSWECARRIADALPTDETDRLAMRIVPRAALCCTAWRVHLDISGTHFEELRQLCTEAGDKASLAIGMTGLVGEHIFHGRLHEASRLKSEQLALIESLGDPTPTPAQPYGPSLLVTAAQDAIAVTNITLGERLARAAVSRGGGLDASELLARSLLWQGKAAEVEETLSVFDPETMSEFELVRWGTARIANLQWSMGDAEGANEVLKLLRSKVTHHGLQLLVDGEASASLLFENQLDEAVAHAERVVADPDASAVAVAWAVSGGALALALMGRGNEAAVVAERGRRVENKVDGLLRYLMAYAEVRALVLAGEFDCAEKRSADVVRINLGHAPGQYVAWGMANVLIGAVEFARGHFADTVTQMEQTVAALTSESAASWSFPARLLLAQSYCALGRVEPGAKMVAELRTRFGQHVALFGPQLRIAESWLAAAEGNVSRAIDLALDAARLARESGQQAIEMLALHDAVRFGDRSCLSRLVDVANATGGRLATALAAHAAAVTDRDADAIFAAAQQLEQIGALLSAADAAAQAAVAYAAAGDRRHAGEAGGTANRLAAECGGLRTPALELAVAGYCPY